ncbi:MAG: tetratricopeptide repeat protein [Planctomycetes bacterium]|nr:tetratricopeptide repeat protein [Planctomycetota bacterium]
MGEGGHPPASDPRKPGEQSTEAWLAGPSSSRDEVSSTEPGGPSAGATDTWSPKAPGRGPDLGRIGRFELRRVVGRGGMGIVYEAWDPDYKRRVAVKTLNSGEVPPDGTAVERFVREARSAARLRHPSIVSVLDVGEDAGRHYLVMDLVDGRSFDRCLRGAESWAEFSLRKRVELLAQIAEALGEAHAKGVIHRDIKPSNILVTSEGRALLTDFGLAGEVDPSDLERLTLAGVVLGTPQFVSPEQASGGSRKAVPASDVYSFGVVLYRAISGKLPFEGHGSQVIDLALTTEAAPPSAENPSVTPDLEAICLRCLSKEPAKRYADGAELAADLKRFLEGRAVHARPRFPVARPRGAIPIAAGVAAVLLLGIGVAWLLARIAAAGDRAERAAPGRQESLVFRNAPDATAADAGGGAEAQLKAARDQAEAERLVAAADASLAAAGPLLAGRWNYADGASQVQAALDGAARAIQRAPAWAPARLARARALAATGDFTAAVAEFREAVRRDPAMDEAHALLARFLLTQAILELAAEEMQDARADTPRAQALRREAAGHFAAIRAPGGAWRTPGEARLDEALAAWAGGDVATAVRVCEEEIAASPGSGRAAGFHLILSRVDAGAARARHIDSAIRLNPGNVAAYFARGLRRLMSPSPDPALEDFGAALLAAPRFAEAHCGRGCALGILGRAGDAGVAFEAALAIDPGLELAFSQRAVVYRRTGRPADALADLDRAVALRNDRAWVFMDRGRLRAQNGDAVGGLADFDRALALIPERALAWYERGQARQALGQRDQAVEDFDQALTLEPGLAVAWYGRGVAHLERGDLTDAHADLSKVIELAPTGSFAWETRGICRLRQGRPREALADFDEAVRQCTTTPGILVNRGSAYLALADPEHAETEFRAALRIGPDDAEAWLGLAQALSLRGQAPEALSAAEKALAKAPAKWIRRAEAEKFLDGLRLKQPPRR